MLLLRRNYQSSGSESRTFDQAELRSCLFERPPAALYPTYLLPIRYPSVTHPLPISELYLTNQGIQDANSGNFTPSRKSEGGQWQWSPARDWARIFVVLFGCKKERRHEEITVNCEFLMRACGSCQR